MAEKEYIERDGVMQKFADRVWLSNHSDFSTTPTWNQAVQIVENFPAADVRPVIHSFWGYNPGDNIPYCDNCGMPQDVRSDFCHSCGADMRPTFVSGAKEE